MTMNQYIRGGPRAGFTTVGSPESNKMWRPLSVTTNLSYDNSSSFVLISCNN
jgi:hypothetical protein